MGFPFCLGVLWLVGSWNVVKSNEQTRKHTLIQLGERARRLDRSPEILPVYPGYGTHFAYLYVGTPPQRQSVIIDTGSHYIAFPCSGCSQCGQHTDNYWDPDNSTTKEFPQCNKQKCLITQSYSEGSSWRAYKVTDKVWVGGLSPFDAPGADSYGVNMQFGCQTSETGLFRTQLADGIMGMSMSEDTLPRQLRNAGVTQSTTFSLCFRTGGGIMTLGGVDETIHLEPGMIKFTNLTSKSGFFSVILLDVKLQDRKTLEKRSLEAPSSTYTNGKGCIVDSGTTDTYLPSSLLAKFSDLFYKIAGVPFEANTPLSTDQLERMPNLVFIFRGSDDVDFEVEMPWSSYVDSVGGGKFAFRIYLSESSGTVLGANFMNGHNVIFDADGGRVGFAKSNCKYEDFAKVVTAEPSAPPTQSPFQTSSGSSPSGCESLWRPVDACNAVCNQPKNLSYFVDGNQTWVDQCQGEASGDKEIQRSCRVPCKRLRLSRGSPNCMDSSWSKCTRVNKACSQSKTFASIDGNSKVVARDLVNSSRLRIHHHRHLQDEKCVRDLRNRSCYTGGCKVNNGDYIIKFFVKAFINPETWSYVYEENFQLAFSRLFQVDESAIEIINDASQQESLSVKLYFEIRLNGILFNEDSIMMHDAVSNILVLMSKPDFKWHLLVALEEASQLTDKINYSRYGWMSDRDLEIGYVDALPIGGFRPPDTLVREQIRSSLQSMDYFLLFIAISAVIVMIFVLLMHFRLRREHYAMSQVNTVGNSLKRMWSGFAKKSTSHGKIHLGMFTGERKSTMAYEMTATEDEDLRDDYQ